MCSAVRLSLIPCPFYLVKPSTAVVDKGGRVTGFVVFIILFCSSWACTCLLVSIAQQTVFQDCEVWLKSEIGKELISKSVGQVPMATGTLL